MSRPPNYEFQEWWNKQRSKEQTEEPLSSSASDDIRFLTVNINSPTSASASASVAEKDRSRSARQLSWIYLLKLNQIAHTLAYLPRAIVSLIRTAGHRLSTYPGGSRSESKFYKVIKFFLILSVCLLVVELAAYYKG